MPGSGSPGAPWTTPGSTDAACVVAVRRPLREMGAFPTLLTERIRAGTAAGELNADLEPEIVVQITATFLQGLLRTALISSDRKPVDRQIDVLLTSVGL